MSKATSKLGPIQEAVKGVAASGAAELLGLACAPPLTWNVLKAMLLVMGKTADQMDTWLQCRYSCKLVQCCTAMTVGVVGDSCCAPQVWSRAYMSSATAYHSVH